MKRVINSWTYNSDNHKVYKRPEGAHVHNKVHDLSPSHQSDNLRAGQMHKSITVGQNNSVI